MHIQSTPVPNIISALNGLAPWKRWAIAVNLGLTLFFIYGWWMIAIDGQFWKADFTQYYTGFTLILHGRGGALYDLALQAQVQKQVLQGLSFSDGLLPFNYPPHSGLLLAWLGLFPLAWAFAIWTVVQLGLLALLLRLLGRIMEDWTGSQKILALSSVLAFSPLAANLLHGQMGLLPCLACVLLYLGMRDNSSRQVVAALLLLTIKPNLLILPVAMVLAVRRWRDLAVMALILGGWIGITTWWLGWQCWSGWVGMLAFTGRTFNQFGIYPQSMYTFRSILCWMLYPAGQMGIEILTWLLLAGCAGGLFWLARCRKIPLALQISGCFVFAVLSAPHLYLHNALVLAPAMVLFFHFLQGTGKSGLLFPTIMALGLAFFLLDYLHLLEGWPFELGVIPLLIMAGWQVQVLFSCYLRNNHADLLFPASSTVASGYKKIEKQVTDE